VSAQELTSGGVLVEVSDSGVGVPEARLVEMNWRLDNPPVIDVSVSRHMGLFAVARLAERHGIRVRLRPRPPQGLTALVWLPDNVADRDAQLSSWPGDRLDRQVTARHATGGHRPATPMQHHMAQVPASQHHTAQAAADPRETARPPGSPAPPSSPAPAGSSTSLWFRSHPPAAAAADGGNPAEAPPPAAPGLPVPGLLPVPGGVDGADRGDRTAAGLPVRVPRANLLPGSADGGRTAKGPAAPQRSPELVRSRLSGFQGGIRRAQGQEPGTGEETGR
jgi:hypothetical protein